MRHVFLFAELFNLQSYLYLLIPYEHGDVTLHCTSAAI